MREKVLLSLLLFIIVLIIFVSKLIEYMIIINIIKL